MDAIAVLCKRLCIRVRFGRLRHAALSSRHGSQNSFQRLPVPSLRHQEVAAVLPTILSVFNVFGGTLPS